LSRWRHRRSQSDTRNDPDIGVYAFSGGDSSLNSDAN
jgi:hypothetical protein